MTHLSYKRKKMELLLDDNDKDEEEDKDAELVEAVLMLERQGRIRYEDETREEKT